MGNLFMVVCMAALVLMLVSADLGRLFLLPLCVFVSFLLLPAALWVRLRRGGRGGEGRPAPARINKPGAVGCALSLLSLWVLRRYGWEDFAVGLLLAAVFADLAFAGVPLRELRPGRFARSRAAARLWGGGLPAATASFTHYSDGRADAPPAAASARPDTARRAADHADDSGRVVVRLSRNSNEYLVHGYLNGEPVTFAIDTGASAVFVPMELARRLNLRTRGKVPVETANGEARCELVRLNEVQIGGLSRTDIEGLAGPHMPDGVVLLGNSFLRHFHIEQSDGRMVISRKR